jgi:hypothetical protein
LTVLQITEEKYGYFGNNGMMESFSTGGGLRNFALNEMVKVGVKGFVRRTKPFPVFELTENQRPSLDEFCRHEFNRK